MGGTKWNETRGENIAAAGIGGLVVPRPFGNGLRLQGGGEASGIALGPLTFQLAALVHALQHLLYCIQIDTIDVRSTPPSAVNIVNATEEFTDWVSALTDVKARAAIYLRIKRAELGNFGEYKVLDEGVSEMKVDVGPGYRVYFAREGRVTYLLLCGGDKSTQKADIKRAKAMWKTIKEQA
ncbi:type II toxin-antitoxin system RelE/ParE family toxin [Trinickia dinghuensis]|uniref:Type II toxin-antitoxin system RelE/ParE family toxin n=2 Tax=Trinickia dinghuensis TaxID=2291023 RepID=A0A3D8K2J8_9BURK|nr:type II toxin-antitoxin system RelE/ParE family toxin [Trinickia dinghuensis]